VTLIRPLGWTTLQDHIFGTGFIGLPSLCSHFLVLLLCFPAVFLSFLDSWSSEMETNHVNRVSY